MKNKWTTKRMFFSVTGLLLATAMVYTGKLDGVEWVYALAVVIAGHHAEDVIKAMKGGSP